ncbi:serine protease inhibitor swm-1-like [Euwallacea similis]|uniref:serine protease inhibitor swm-1-like n=1 Tax=Euwallacea similis TaxID=1736056 RepID=UPI00344E0339
MKASFVLLLAVLAIFGRQISSAAIVCSKPNEQYSNCGTPCEETCTYQPEVCILVCKQGCFCKPGYVRNNNGDCILKSQCFTYVLNIKSISEIRIYLLVSMKKSSVIILMTIWAVCVSVSWTQTCTKDNETYNLCGPACEPTCAQPVRFCITLCTPGCFCTSGYLRNDTGECVLTSEC